MRYVVGIDGGGSKTHLVLADAGGSVLQTLTTDCTNHQICGIEAAMHCLTAGYERLLKNAGALPGDVAHVCIGLSGLDLQQDYQLVESHLDGPLKTTAHTLLNDLWIALAAGEMTGFGAASICGTGHNTGVVGKDGTRYGISALRFPLGNFGGGRMLTDYALHRAFRYHEGTGEYTALVKRLPELCNVASMDELLVKIYESGYQYYLPFAIPKLVDQLALEGDRVCIDLLSYFGSQQGQMTGRLLHKAGLEGETVPVVLVGSLYVKRMTDIITDAFALEVGRYCKRPVLQSLERAPVAGAVVLAAESLGSGAVLAKEVLERLDRTLLAVDKEMGEL